MNYYELLGVSKTSDHNEIKKQYYKLAKEYHPDKTKGDKCKEEKFINIQKAYDTLIDKDKKIMYDLTLNEDEIFETISNLFSFKYDDENVEFHHNDIKSEKKCKHESLQINIEEYLFGINRKHIIKEDKSCRACNETGINDYMFNTKRCNYCNGTGFDLNIPLFACGACNGKCINIINNIPCNVCKGKKTYSNEHEIHIIMEKLLKEGSLVESNGYKFKIKHTFKNDIDIVDSHVIVKINISIIKWLCGGEIRVKVYESKIVNIQLKGAFDLSKDYIVCENIKIRFSLTMVPNHIEILRKCINIFNTIFKRHLNVSDIDFYDLII